MRLVSRSQWGARAPRSTTRLDLPAVRGFAVHWEGPHMGAFAHTECAAKVRGVQRFHMDTRGWTDIAYSFLVCPHGFVFAGRGWNSRTAANGTNDGNARYWAACYLGGEGDPFTALAKEAYGSLFAEGHRRVQSATAVRPHSFFKPTACPGDEIRRWIAQPPALTEPQEARMPLIRYADGQRAVGCAVRPQGDGYWMLASDGGVFAFGNAPSVDNYLGLLKAPVVSFLAWPDGKGHFVTTADGAVYARGSAKHLGAGN